LNLQLLVIGFVVFQGSTATFLRSTKPMGIVVGEMARYTLLTFIALKMELHGGQTLWEKCERTCPSGRAWSIKEFTQSL
jgi:hypothetical protein